MTRDEFEDRLHDLESAEDFLEFFDVPCDPHVVHVNRLHILQRFHDYLASASDRMPDDAPARHALYRSLLARACHDFVESDALTEKVFRVFHAARGGQFVAADTLTPRPSPAPAPPAGSPDI